MSSDPIKPMTLGEKADLLRGGIPCQEWPACDEFATRFDENDVAWCDDHGNTDDRDELRHKLREALEEIVELRASFMAQQESSTTYLNRERARAKRWKNLAKKLFRQARPTRGELIVAEATASARVVDAQEALKRARSDAEVDSASTKLEAANLAHSAALLALEMIGGR